MSCNACFLAVKATMMKPMPNRKAEMYFAKCLAVARANEMRPPSVPVTTIDMARLPTVACHSELSIKASYNQWPNSAIRMPAPKVIAVTIPPTALTTMKSISQATKRAQKPAYDSAC